MAKKENTNGNEEIQKEKNAAQATEKKGKTGKPKVKVESKGKETELDKLKAERDELQDKYLRLYSDFENFKRRSAKEKIDLIDYASENVMIEILPVLDDFDRAIKSMKDANEISSIFDGVNLIYHKLKKSLEGKGLHEVECIGKDFDPEIHEALNKIPAPKKKLVGKVVDQVQKGYSLNGKVIRHSQVIVGA
ncbi:MAG: nucleotide exchange factor GrpE [Bacteroidetes bacterium]|nr:nucleotide exchange factor GrpE [Bacteroidota bacterium]